jgi:hypothetical protein
VQTRSNTSFYLLVTHQQNIAFIITAFHNTKSLKNPLLSSKKGFFLWQRLAAPKAGSVYHQGFFTPYILLEQLDLH